MRRCFLLVFRGTVADGAKHLAHFVLVHHVGRIGPQLAGFLDALVRLLDATHFRHNAKNHEQHEQHAQKRVEEVRHDGIVNTHGRVAQHGSLRLLGEDAAEKHDPRGNGNNQAHRRRRGVDDVAQHLTRRFLFIGNRQNGVCRNQNGQVIVDEDDHAAQPREEQHLALAFDVFTRPVRHGRSAVALTQQLHEAPEQQADDHDVVVVGVARRIEQRLHRRLEEVGPVVEQEAQNARKQNAENASTRDEREHEEAQHGNQRDDS